MRAAEGYILWIQRKKRYKIRLKKGLLWISGPKIPIRHTTSWKITTSRGKQGRRIVKIIAIRGFPFVLLLWMRRSFQASWGKENGKMCLSKKNFSLSPFDRFLKTNFHHFIQPKAANIQICRAKGGENRLCIKTIRITPNDDQYLSLFQFTPAFCVRGGGKSRISRPWTWVEEEW